MFRVIVGSSCRRGLWICHPQNRRTISYAVLKTFKQPTVVSCSSSAGEKFLHASIETRHLASHLHHRNRLFVHGYFTKSKSDLEVKNAAHLKNNMSTLETLKFDNLVLRTLPVDEDERNCIRQVAGACFSLVEPTPVSNPRTVAYSAAAMALLDLSETELERSEFAEYFSGNKVLPGARPAAHCYCGHQFGYFSGQLGDGATMYLGEVVNQKGERWEIQFKGAGLTPYSRTADGRKVLRSSIREFLCSEAMHHLGIPTTRGGSCITTDTTVVRDIFYDGNPTRERATVILRIAPTFLRFGSFEIFKPTDKMTGRQGPSVGRTDILEKMLDYTIKTFFPQVYEAYPDNREERQLAFYKQVVSLTAALAAEWQCVGFCHGVLNTDNMSILGLTIDYGPFGFMDAFDPDHVCNGSDDQGRYSFKSQPEICKWNLLKFAEAIKESLPFERSEAALEDLYDAEFKKCYMSKMRKKLGLLNKEFPEDEDLAESLLETMHKTGSDFTNTFRYLHKIPLPGCSGHVTEGGEDSVLDLVVRQCQTVEDLKKACRPQMDVRQFQMLMVLLQSNPALAAQLGSGMASLQKELDKREIANKLKDLTPDAKKAKDRDLWSAWIARYRSRLSQEVQGQDQSETANEKRVRVMKSTNPRFILRNYIAQNAISLAEKGDYSEFLERTRLKSVTMVWKVLKLLENPYSDDVDVSVEVKQSREVETESGERLSVPQTPTSVNLSCSHDGTPFDSKPPNWTLDIKVT